MALKVCSVPGCPNLQAEPKCIKHRREAEALRGSSTARGYDAAHFRERKRWAPIVKRGHTNCARCGLPIAPSDAWDLDHTPDRKGYLGPSHASCNRAAH